MTAATVIQHRRGSTRITTRAMTRVVSAVAADALGVRPSQVSVRLADADGGLDLTVRAPIRVVPLHDSPLDTAAETPADGTILDRTDRAQRRIRGTVADLTGAQIAGVVVRLTGARIRRPDRVD
ncbi:hypothetical protein [Cryobacterium arcticum]|uniref:Uncharacterized protein n=1 Tax=Cryobacterium arcticum TaxID=670052 RepID=A0A1B1BQN3_9MICO|nr:hypothetical protein [Cryobacterium arcticum]ANP74683.1 hypothetical protein PA27867_3768 [Cryobacterium arcticum]